MKEFKPTALLIKTHTITGLKYFCKSTNLSNLESYSGSGKYWKKHLIKHGKTFTTGVVGIYYEKQRCVDSALRFSEEQNIVDSKEWANLRPENGLDGGARPDDYVFSDETKEKMAKSGGHMKGKKQSPEHIAKRAAAMVGNKNGIGNKGNTGGIPWNKGLRKQDNIK